MQIGGGGLTVSESEQPGRVRTRHASAAPKGRSAKGADTLALERDLSGMLGLTVTIDLESKGGAGSITIGYSDFDQLDDIVQRLNRQAGPARTPSGRDDPDDDPDAVDIPSRPESVY